MSQTIAGIETEVTGQCHCGNVTLVIPRVTESATQCNCSICSRYATLWGYFTRQEVTVILKDDGIDNYCWGDKTILFHRCKACGCVTHYTSSDKVKNDRLAVNYRMFNPTVISNIHIRRFDGADTWRFLD